MKAVYFFCTNSNNDYVASNILKKVCELKPMETTNLIFDDKPVLSYIDDKKNVFSLVETEKTLCSNYANYLKEMNLYFSDYDFAGFINWHAGSNAPEKVLTIHSTGDVASGFYSPCNPIYYKNLIIAMEKFRKDENLDDFFTSIEATHWSGIDYNQNPEDITKFNVPLYDIEIGSTKDSWNNEKAINILSKSLFEVFTPYSIKNKNTFNILAVGGIHFEDSFSKMILNSEYPLSIAHHIPNQWLVSGKYEENGLEKLENATLNVNGEINAIIFHDGLKSVYKQLCRDLGEKLNVPVYKHKILKTPDEIFKNKN